MEKITSKVWQQYEAIRATGDTDICKESGVFEAALKYKFMPLIKVLQEKRFIELISGYSKALADKKFRRLKYKEDVQ